jgi:hypothetical protein
MELQDNLGPMGDAFFAALMAAHEGLSDAESQALNARLILILANEVGDLDRLVTLIEAARGAPEV